jgi:hypothetical protein
MESRMEESVLAPGKNEESFRPFAGPYLAAGGWRLADSACEASAPDIR